MITLNHLENCAVAMDEKGIAEHLRSYLPTLDYFNQITADINSRNSKSALLSLDESKELLTAIVDKLSPETISWYEQLIDELRTAAINTLAEAPHRSKFLPFA